VARQREHVFVRSEPDLLESAFPQPRRLAVSREDAYPAQARDQQFVQRHDLHPLPVQMQPQTAQFEFAEIASPMQPRRSRNTDATPGSSRRKSYASAATNPASVISIGQSVSG